MLQTVSGSCQCGEVRYRAQASLESVIACNCSRCRRLGSLLAFTPADQFELLSGEGAQTEFRFNKHHLQHLFCSTCGIQVFCRGIGPDGTPVVALNARCMDDIDIGSLTVHHYDGASV